MITKLGLMAAAATIGLSAWTAPAAIAQGGSAVAKLSVPPLAYKTRKLRNGLTVYTLRDTATPNVSVSLWYEVGAKHDPAGRSGFAHLFEHILSRKTVNMPYNMINKLTEDVGGVRNASTSWDRTNYYETVPARYLETMLWTHAERMARPVVDAEVFENERNVVKEELRQRVLAPPYGRLGAFVMTENAWDRAPHRRPTIGSITDLESAKLEDARAFHEAFYGPDTATLIVAGNFDEAQLSRWIDNYFGAIQARPRKTSLVIKERDAPRTRERFVTAYAPNVPLPVATSLWQTPGSAHPDVPVLSVLNAILTRGNNSRLYQGLVEKGLASNVSGNLVDTEESGFYAPIIILAGGKSVTDAEAALALELERLRSAPVTSAELFEAKNELIADALRQRETSQGRAFALGEALVRTSDPRAPDKELAAIQRVSAADITRVARKYLAPNSRVAIRYVSDKDRPSGQTGNSWANPNPLPVFASIRPATRPANALAPEGQRQQPPAPGAAVAVTPPVIAESKLANGMTLVTARTGNVPIATMTMVFRGGAATDPRGKAGLATLAADLATRGTATRSAQEIAIELESLGASIASGAGPDGISVSVSAPATNLEAAGRILADIVQNASFPTDEFERQRTRAVDAFGVAMRDPGALASMVLLPAVYGDAPYGSLAGGTVTSLKGLTRDDLLEAYRTWWHPANAALVVSGGINPQATEAMTQRLFGSWRGQGPAPLVPTARAGNAQKVRTIVVDMPGAGQAAVVAAVRGVDRADPDYYNMVIANAILGSGSNGRLFEEVRTKRALSYGANSNLPARADDAVLTASSQTKNESAADVAKIFLDELDRLGSQPLAPDQIQKRKAYVSGIYTLQSETSSGFGATLAGLIQQGLSPSEAVRYLENVDAVTADAASKAATRISAANRATLVIVGDSSQFIEKVRALRPDVEVISADQLNLDLPKLRAN